MRVPAPVSKMLIGVDWTRRWRIRQRQRRDEQGSGNVGSGPRRLALIAVAERYAAMPWELDSVPTVRVMKSPGTSQNPVESKCTEVQVL